MAPMPIYPQPYVNTYCCSYHDAWGQPYAQCCTVSVSNPSYGQHDESPVVIRNRKSRELYFGFVDSFRAMKAKADAIAARSPMVRKIQRVMRRHNDSSFTLRFA